MEPQMANPHHGDLDLARGKRAPFEPYNYPKKVRKI
jgi:hypothetical protein